MAVDVPALAAPQPSNYADREYRCSEMRLEHISANAAPQLFFVALVGIINLSLLDRYFYLLARK